MERAKILEFCGKDFFEKRGNYYIIPNDPCPYLTQDNHCSIEQVKPIDCKTYPVGPIIKSGRTTFGIAEDCPAKYLLTKKYLADSKKLLRGLTQKQQEDLFEFNESQEIYFREKNASFGLELVLDMYGCDTALFAKYSVSGYFEGVCKETDTEKYGEPIFYYDNSDTKHSKVIATMQFVDNSSIRVYALSVLGTVYINLFSCGKIDVKRVESLSEDFFKAEKAISRVIERK